MRARVVMFVVLALAAVSWVSPLAAAITEKPPIKQVKAASKTRLGLLKSTLDAAQVTVVARIDAFEVAVATNGFTVLGVQNLADDLADFQTAVQEALFDVAVDTAADGKTALVDLADGGTLAAIPLALASLPGGVPDQVRASVGKFLVKTYRTVNKRLAKTSALVATVGDATLFVVLDPPPQLSFAFSDQRSDAVLFNLAIDLRVSASTTNGDGRIWVGGTTFAAGQNLVVSAIAMDALTTSADQPVVTAGRGRFLARLGDSVTLPRANYLLGVVPVTLGASASSSFALR
jgi:hypothetical protein